MVYQICYIPREERLVRFNYQGKGDIAIHLVSPIFKGLQLDWNRNFGEQYDAETARKERTTRQEALERQGVSCFYSEKLNRSVEFSPEWLNEMNAQAA